MFAGVLRTGPHSQVYLSGECSGSRLAQVAKGDIEFLESALQASLRLGFMERLCSGSGVLAAMMTMTMPLWLALW
jgi:hypothetical protein